MLRQQKKERTRVAVAEAAFRLFREHGFDAVTVDQIAAEALIGRRTFFRYFDTKEAVFFARQEDRLSAFQSWLDSPEPGEGPYDTVRRAMLTMARRYEAMGDELLVQDRIVKSSKSLTAMELALDEHWEAAIARTLMEGGVDPLPAQVHAAALMATARVVLRHWFATDGSLSLSELGQQALDLLPLEPA